MQGKEKLKILKKLYWASEKSKNPELRKSARELLEKYYPKYPMLTSLKNESYNEEIGDSMISQSEMIEISSNESLNDEMQNEKNTNHKTRTKDLITVEYKRDRMKSKIKKIGIALILIGLFIPLITFPFSELTHDGAEMTFCFFLKSRQYKPRIKDFEIVLKEGTEVKSQTGSEKKIKGRISIPYNWIVGYGITIVFCGLWLFLITGRKYQTE